jgi:hypothetical protein
MSQQTCLVSITLNHVLLPLIELVVSFPILILRKSPMKRKRKFWITFLLSLSVFVIIIALVRVLGSIRPGELQLDATWQLLWQLLEVCVAVMAASTTTMRSAFVRRERNECMPDPQWPRTVLPPGLQILTTPSEEEDNISFPQIPLAVVRKGESMRLSGLSQWRTVSSIYPDNQTLSLS